MFVSLGRLLRVGMAGQEADGGEVGGGGGGVELREMGLRVGRGRLRSSEVAVWACGVARGRRPVRRGLLFLVKVVYLRMNVTNAVPTAPAEQAHTTRRLW
jgi:hypothetical protein